MIRFPMRIPASLPCLVALLAGCGGTVDARVPLKGRRLLVIPFRQGSAAEFDSPLGRDLAQALNAALAPNLPRKAALLDFRDAERLLPVPRGALVDWPRLGRTLRADLVLLGEIREHRLRDPKTTGLQRGTLVVDYRVLDAAAGAVRLTVPGRTFHFPPDNSGSEEGFNFGMDAFADPAKVSRGLMDAAAEGIAEDFYDHEAHP